MRVRLVAAVALFVTVGVSVGAQAPDCTPLRLEYLLWGAAGAGQVPTPGDDVGGGYPNGGYVPDTEVWQIRAAGLSSTISLPAEYMLEIQHKVWSAANVCCWLIPVQRMAGSPNGTPTIALDHPLVLHAGERLGGRVNGITGTTTIGLFYVGWKFPAACTAALILPGTTNITVSAPVDFSAMTAAATSLQNAATALKASIPK